MKACLDFLSSPDAPHNSERSPPPEQHPASPGECNAQHSKQANRAVPGFHTRTPTLAACGQRPTSCPKDGQPGEGERLTPDAPHEGTQRRPPAMPSCNPHGAQRRLARACALESEPGAHTPTSRGMQRPVEHASQKGQCRLPAPAPPHPKHVGSRPQISTPKTSGRGRMSA